MFQGKFVDAVRIQAIAPKPAPKPVQPVPEDDEVAI
jgi:hypothetical protein